MLSDSSTNDNVILTVIFTPIVQRFNNFLRFHQFTLLWLRGSERERVSRFPVLDFIEPLLSFGGDRW